MSRPHIVPFDIAFKHCDPAGIVFYPRYVEMLNDTIEHWFKHELGADFRELHMNRRMGIPVVNLNVDFMSPGRLGEAVLKKLYVEKLGRSSVGLRIDIVSAEPPHTPKISARMTIVFAGLDAIKPTEIPADIRARIQAMLDDAA